MERPPSESDMTTVPPLSCTAVIRPPYTDLYSMISLTEGDYSGSELLFTRIHRFDPAVPSMSGTEFYKPIVALGAKAPL
jgi:hypothetical protein